MSADAQAAAKAGQAAEIAEWLNAERKVVIDRILNPAAEGATAPPHGGMAEARVLSDIMDSALKQMFQAACLREGAAPEQLPIALVATGGYGRQTLSPYSDIDITFIPQRDGDPLIDRIIRDVFSQVMDICITRCGLEVGYAYRLMSDCDRLDPTTTCGLLDARLITGSPHVYIRFEDAFWSGFNPTDFIFGKADERLRALVKRGPLVRVVEPNLKEGAGGLRDFQTAVWLAQASCQLPSARVRGSGAIESLVRCSQIGAHDALSLAASRERIVQTRNALHAITGAERDELVITRQERVAAALGYRDDGASPPVERMMAELYPAMDVIRRVADEVIRSVGNSRLIVGIGLDCVRREIVPANDSLDLDDPVWLLWANEVAQRYNIELGSELEQAAVTLVRNRPAIANGAQASAIFTEIIRRPGRVYKTVQKMADLGILSWFLPEFGEILDLIPYDPSHDHTVGQHSLLVVQNLDALVTLRDAPEEVQEMRRVFEELANPERLILAGLLHDSGKAAAGRPHSEVSEEIVERVCSRLGWAPDATAAVKFLVRQHLLMAEVSRLRDINEEETLRDFRRQVPDLESLNMLYLLTYADTRAVGEGVWSQVKARQLRELWHRAAGALSEDDNYSVDEEMLARARRRLARDLNLENLPPEDVAEHVEAMPATYLLSEKLQNIALHIGFVRRVRDGAPVIDFLNEPHDTYTEVTICAQDDPAPGLLSKIAGCLAAAGLSVHSAQVFTRVTARDRIALDRLLVDYRGRQLSPGKQREVSTSLSTVLSGTETVEQLMAARRKSGVSSTPPPLRIISVRNDLSDTLSVIEASGPDVQGALYWFCTAISGLGWDIRSARISTWKGEARVSFYIAGARGFSEHAAHAALEARLPSGAAQPPAPP